MKVFQILPLLEQRTWCNIRSIISDLLLIVLFDIPQEFSLRITNAILKQLILMQECAIPAPLYSYVGSG